MVDRLLLEPTLTNEQLALEFGMHEQTIAVVRRTDMFQAMLEDRRLHLEAKVDQTVLDKLQGKVARLADKAVDTLTEQLDRERSKLHDSVQRGTLETTEMALKAIGLIRTGGAASAPPTVHIDRAVIVDKSVLDEARAKMRALHAQSTSSGEGVGNPTLLPAPT